MKHYSHIGRHQFVLRGGVLRAVRKLLRSTCFLGCRDGVDIPGAMRPILLFCSSQLSNHPFELRANLLGRPFQLRIVDRPHGGDRIDGRHFRLTVAGIADHDVAGHRADFVLELEGFVGQRRIAGTEDPVAGEIDPDLLQRLPDVDLGKDAKTLLFKCLTNPERFNPVYSRLRLTILR